MKNFFLKYCIVALVCINATIVFAQNSTPIDSLLTVVAQQIRVEEYIAAEKLLDSLKTVPEYKIDATKLKVDFALAILYQTQNRDEQALGILLKGLSRIKENTSSKYIADYAYEIGSKFSKIKNYPKALDYFRLVLENSKYRNDSLMMSKGFLGLGSMHLHYYQDSRRGVISIDSITQKIYGDSVKYYYNNAIDIFPNQQKDKRTLALLSSNLAAFSFYQNDLETAQKHAKESLKLYGTSGDSIKMVRVINILGAIYHRQTDYKNAEKLYLQGLDLVNSRLDNESLIHKKTFFQNLGHLYFLEGKYKEAYGFKEKYGLLKDSLRNASDNEKYAEFEAKYNLSEKEKLAEIEKSKRKNAEVWLYVFSISTGVLLLFLWLVYRSDKYKRQKQELEFQKENLLQERTLEKVQNEAQIKILNATIDGKEAERRHIAEILHDSVSALLSSAGLHLQAAKIELKENAPEEIAKSQAIVREAGEKIRDLSHKLISSILLKFGLAYAMDDLCQKYSNSKLTFESDSKDVQRYSSEFEIKIHSIIEELINNILKHSNAANANILIKQFEGQLQIRIFDDGDGFDVEKIRINDSGGLGLTQIEARIKMMKGVFDIKSSKETGTRIFINVPIPDLD